MDPLVEKRSLPLEQEPTTWVLRLESLSWLCLSLLLYYALEGTLALFLSLFLVPDLSLVGYLLGPKPGAFFYNCLHTEVGPVLLLVGGVVVGMASLLWIGLIWLAHVHFDRLLGFGLKRQGSFYDTHLGQMSLFKKKS